MVFDVSFGLVSRLISPRPSSEILNYSISIAWIANFLLIDYFYFAPSLVVRIDGIMTKWMDSYSLYQISFITYGFSMASSQLIFCNRVFLIMNMYKGLRSIRQIFLEALIYIFVGLIPLSTIPVVWEMTPDQKKAKKDVIENCNVYPDCVYEDTSVIICNPMNHCAVIFAIMNLCYIFFSTFIMFFATHMAYKLLSKRMVTKSNKTKKMHKKFNMRTRLQAIVVFFFAMFPILVANLTLLLDIEIAWPSYFIDFLWENQPNASLLTLFLFYDPYQLYMKTIWKHYKNRFSSKIMRVKSARPSENHIVSVRI
ncbi:hypothetical protein CRE_09161 [Caenorhabditis remanei]|uniref:G-protein coupled receptors family 1 profile domain-containing protein n=1 Tax=Caenorhabditis remanei TaxID=31234 RepID=E3LH87_CAERE|nr:hypothetical protein CRE_09161 [Caenorhabditis remanei]